MRKFNQSKKNDLTYEGEAVRLSNELRERAAFHRVDTMGKSHLFLYRAGFDIETAPQLRIKNWLNNNPNSSRALIEFVNRVHAARFLGGKNDTRHFGKAGMKKEPKR